MLAEQIAGQVAKGGGIGIADQILSKKSETSSA
jgi:Rod binding domain-containing protein